MDGCFETTLTDSSSDASEKMHSTPKEKGPKVHTSFRINPVVELFQKMKGEKEVLLKQIGLHGLTHLPREAPECNRSFNWQLAFNLLKDLDSETGSLDFGSRGRIDIKCEDVGLVFGISSSGSEMKRSDPLKISTTKQLVKKGMLLDDGSELNLENIRMVLEREIPADGDSGHRKAFIMAAYIIAVSYFLAPRGRPPRVNNEILECILDTGNVQNINWASYVLQTLRDASAKLKKELKAQTKTVTLDGCLLLLQIVYLDNLDLGILSTKHDLIPRVKDFPFKTLDKLIIEDRKAISGSKLRVDEESLYTRGDLCRSILMSRQRIAAGVFLRSDKSMVLEYVKKQIEEGKRRVRIASQQFEEEAISTLDQCQQEISRTLDIYMTGRVTREDISTLEDRENDVAVEVGHAKGKRWGCKITTRQSKVRKLGTTSNAGGDEC